MSTLGWIWLKCTAIFFRVKKLTVASLCFFIIVSWIVSAVVECVGLCLFFNTHSVLSTGKKTKFVYLLRMSKLLNVGSSVLPDL